MATILLARHGETDWNLARRVQGHSDRPLNETGREQATELAARLARERLTAIYSSDLVRAHETARIVAARLGLGVTVEPDLRERDFGTWEGLTDDEIRSRFPEAGAGEWGDAETREEMAHRVLGAFRRIAARHDGERVLIVAHGGPLRALLRHCGADGSGPIENCRLLRLESEDGVLRVLD